MWQEIIVGLCVVGALLFVLRRWLPIGAKKTMGCGSGCGDCANTKGCSSTEPIKASDRQKDA